MLTIFFFFSSWLKKYANKDIHFFSILTLIFNFTPK